MTKESITLQFRMPYGRLEPDLDFHHLTGIEFAESTVVIQVEKMEGNDAIVQINYSIDQSRSATVIAANSMVGRW